MNIDADALFKAKHENVLRLALYLGFNPFGIPRRAIVLGILFRIA